jgi:hypothetical protein
VQSSHTREDIISSVSRIVRANVEAATDFGRFGFSFGTSFPVSGSRSRPRNFSSGEDSINRGRSFVSSSPSPKIVEGTSIRFFAAIVIDLSPPRARS